MTSCRIPTYRRQKQKNGPDRAFCELNGHRNYFGQYDDPVSKEAYHRLIAEWLANGQSPPSDPDNITITGICARYYQHVEATYREPVNYKPAIRILRKLYGNTLAADFGPLALKAVIGEMVEQGWARKYVNKNLGRIKRMLKWAKNNEFVPSKPYDRIRDVEGLKRGQTTAPETDKIMPVPDEHIEAICDYTSRQVWAMIQLQLLTGARPGEIVIMRPVDIDTSADTWIYRPTDHKTAHRDHKREIYIGKRGQGVLEQFLSDRLVNAFLFSPAEADRERKIRMRAERKSKVQPSQIDRSKANPKRKPGERYTTISYARAIAYAVKQAFRPEGMSDSEFRKWKPQEHWSPNQLRHNAGTYLRKEFGLEVASIILGHRKVDVTQVYAERDFAKAIDVIGKVG